MSATQTGPGERVSEHRERSASERDSLKGLGCARRGGSSRNDSDPLTPRSVEQRNGWVGKTETFTPTTERKSTSPIRTKNRLVRSVHASSHPTNWIEKEIDALGASRVYASLPFTSKKGGAASKLPPTSPTSPTSSSRMDVMATLPSGKSAPSDLHADVVWSQTHCPLSTTLPLHSSWENDSHSAAFAEPMSAPTPQPKAIVQIREYTYLMSCRVVRSREILFCLGGTTERGPVLPGECSYSGPCTLQGAPSGSRGDRLRPTPNVQRPTPNAQRPTPNVQRSTSANPQERSSEVVVAGGAL